MDWYIRISIASASLLLLLTSAPVPPASGRVVSTASMHERREDHTSTLLPNGRVLIAGGMVENGVFLSSAELYDPSNGRFVPTDGMQSRRAGHSATLLPDGKVLIAGGLAGRRFEGGPGVVATTEIYDPASGRFAPGPTMSTPRSGHAALLLLNGRVLVAGGVDADERPLSTSEIYDPASGRFTATASMHTSRVARGAVLLKDGRVLVTGGGDLFRNAMTSAEIYDPRTAFWQSAGNMTSPREKHAAAVLSDGRVLITGGSADGQWHPVRSAELFDPHTNRFTAVPNKEMARFKLPDASVRLKDGNVLVAGGAAEVEIYDQAAGRFNRAGSVAEPHYFAQATLLHDGRVLISGGYGTGAGRANGPLSTERAWVYQP